MSSLLRRLRSRFLLIFSKAIFRVQPRPDLKKLGGEHYGGWVVPISVLSESSICYCAGVGEDITFDLALIDTFGCDVFAFDPTPRAVRHVNQHAAGLAKYHFHDVGLWSDDQVLKFFVPQDPTHVSHSVVNLAKTSNFFEAPCRRLSSLMRDLGHHTIDLLKLDVEGAEYEVLNSMIEDQIAPMVLCVEFDQPVPYKKTLAMVRKLIGVGYRLVNIDGWNYTFIRV